MRKTSLALLSLIIVILSLGLPENSFCQSNEKDYADIYIYRPKQSMVKGGTAVEIKISLNGKEIGSLLNRTMLRYRLYSQGPVKMRCFGALGGGGISTPYSETINFEHGKEYHIVLSFGALKGVSAERLSGNKIKKMKKMKFSDEMELEEDKSNPILGSPTSSLYQGDEKKYADLYLYRPKQSLVSGAIAVEIKISLNDKEIGSLLNNTMMRYRLYSQGPNKMKCVGEVEGGGIGSPYVETINFEHGKEYHVILSFGALKGVSGKILKEKRVKKMRKEKFSDEMELEEDGKV
jgi:hypothetical protein